MPLPKVQRGPYVRSKGLLPFPLTHHPRTRGLGGLHSACTRRPNSGRPDPRGGRSGGGGGTDASAFCGSHEHRSHRETLFLGALHWHTLARTFSECPGSQMRLADEHHLNVFLSATIAPYRRATLLTSNSAKKTLNLKDLRRAASRDGRPSTGRGRTPRCRVMRSRPA